MTSKVVHNNRNGHFACYFFYSGAMISSLAKVVGLQSRQNQDPKFQLLKDRNSRHRKLVPHDRRDNISHTTY